MITLASSLKQHLPRHMYAVYVSIKILFFQASRNWKPLGLIIDGEKDNQPWNSEKIPSYLHLISDLITAIVKGSPDLLLNKTPFGKQRFVVIKNPSSKCTSSDIGKFLAPLFHSGVFGKAIEILPQLCNLSRSWDSSITFFGKQ